MKQCNKHKNGIYCYMSLCLFTRFNKNWFPLKLTQQTFVISFHAERQILNQRWNCFSQCLWFNLTFVTVWFLRVLLLEKAFWQCLQVSRSGTTEVSLSRQAGARSLVRRLPLSGRQVASRNPCSFWRQGHIINTSIYQNMSQRQLVPRNPWTLLHSTIRWSNNPESRFSNCSLNPSGSTCIHYAC